MKWLKQWFADIAGLKDGFLVIAALVYGCGYLILAYHAWQLGTGTAPGLRLQYFTAGVPPFVLLCYVVWSVLYGGAFVRRVRARMGPDAKGFWLFARRAMPVVFLAGALTHAVSESLLGEPEPISSACAAVALLLGLVFFPPGLASQLSRWRMRWPSLLQPRMLMKAQTFVDKLFQPLVEPFVTVYSLVTFHGIGIAFSVALVLLYVAEVYPAIPQEFGGIRPRPAVLDVLTEHLSAPTREVLAVPDEEGGVAQTREVEVLLETGDAYWIRVSPSKPGVLELQRDAVTAVEWRE